MKNDLLRVGRLKPVLILLWLSIAPGSPLSAGDTVPASNTGNSSGAPCAFEAFRPSDRDLMRTWPIQPQGGCVSGNSKEN